MKKRDTALAQIERLLLWLGVVGPLVFVTTLKYAAGKTYDQALLAGTFALVQVVAAFNLVKSIRTRERIESQLDTIKSLLEDRSSVQYIEALSEVYRTATEMISRASGQICDTTWGAEKELHDYSVEENTERERYRTALSDACRRGAHIRDLFGRGSRERHDRMISALRRANALQDERRSDYKLRYVGTVGTDAPVLDFMIVDAEEVLFTWDKKTYFYGRGSQLGRFFQAMFERYWGQGKRVSLSSQEQLIVDGQALSPDHPDSAQ